MVVSVVLISHNERGRLQQTVDALRVSTDLATEIIVVDDVSIYSSAEFLAGVEYRDVQLIQQSTRAGVAAARNIGAAAADSDVVVFSDAHVIPQAGWLYRSSTHWKMKQSAQ